MSETKFGTWAPPESAIVVEYSLAVIEEIRQAVADGFQRFARGGIEVGGVLYGTLEESTIRILAIREIACEHLTGPSFQLSEKDRAAFAEQLVAAQTDSQLEGYQPLGFYVSHTRSEIALQPTELDIFNERFPGSHQVVMIVRPGRAGRMRAGFFVRKPMAASKPIAATSISIFPIASFLLRPLRKDAVAISQLLRRSKSPPRSRWPTPKLRRR
jgi:hypothetical protein